MRSDGIYKVGNQTMNSKERLNSIDCVKGVAILLVVLGHAVQLLKGSEAANHDRLFNYIYSFHMPLFMFISGYLSYKQLISFSDVRKRAYQLLPPFFFFPLFVGLAFKGTVCVNTFKHLIERPDSGLWFFYVLFMISSYYTIVMTIFERSVYGGG